MKNFRDVPLAKYLGMLALKFFLPVFGIKSAKLYFLLGNLALDRYKTTWALKAFEKALKYADKERNMLLAADIMRKWGYALLHTEGPTKAAFEKINEAVEIAYNLLIDSKSGDNKEIIKVAANAHAARGNYFHDAGKFDEARYDFEMAFTLARMIDFHQRVVTAEGDLGLVALEQKDWQEAQRWLDVAAKNAERYYPYTIPSSLLRKGRLFMERDDVGRGFDSAELYLQGSLRTAKENGWKREEADALEYLSRLRTMQGKEDEAKSMHEEAQRIYTKIRYRAHLEKAP